MKIDSRQQLVPANSRVDHLTTWHWEPDLQTNYATRPWSCPESNGPQAEYEHRKQIYKAAVDALFDTGYQVSDAQHKKLKTAVENALIDLDVARLRLGSSLRTNGPAARA